MKTINALGISAVLLFAQQAVASNESAAAAQADRDTRNAISTHCTMFENMCRNTCNRNFGSSACYYECTKQFNKCFDEQMARYQEQVKLREKWRKAQILAQAVLETQEQILPDNSSK